RALLRRVAPPAATVLAGPHEPATSPVDPGSKMQFGHPISPDVLGLTERQGDVLALIMQGKSNKAICRTLNLAEATVKYHVTSILKALKVTNRTEAVVAVRDMKWELPSGNRVTMTSGIRQCDDACLGNCEYTMDCASAPPRSLS